MKTIDRACLQVAKAYGAAVATALILKRRGQQTMEEQEASIEDIGAAIASVRGNRHQDTPTTWEDLRLVLLAGLRQATEILEDA